MVKANRGLYAADLPDDPVQQAALLRWVKEYNDGLLDLIQLVDMADAYGVRLTVTESTTGMLLADVDDWTTFIAHPESGT